MVLYFSGTGNSRYVAKQIAEKSNEKIISIGDRIRNKDNKRIDTDGRLIFVVPTYAWRIPIIVKEWIQNTKFSGENKAWFVMTCGSETGNAAKCNKDLCTEKGFTYMGTASVAMPENYIAMFKVPEEDEIRTIMTEAKPVIETIIKNIEADKSFPETRHNLIDSFLSRTVNPVFYRLFVKSDPFYATEQCCSCGKCVTLCPLNNIRLADGKPKWGRECTHCMACISCCPEAAIEYGRKSIGQNRYFFKEDRNIIKRALTADSCGRR